MSKIMMFSGSANFTLAKEISLHLDIPQGKATVSEFSDGETMVEILENVRGKDVYIVQSTSRPANKHIMELMLMADALRRASAHRITALMPYFGYARQDRRVRSARVPITAKVVADMLASVGISRVVTVDLHADQIQGFFHMPVDNVYTTPVMIEDIQNQGHNDVVVVSPDVGGVVRARAMAKQLNDSDLAIIDKRRTGPNKTQVMHVIGEVKNRHCILVDDIADTASTLCTAANQLKQNGAKSVTAYITHPVLSGKAIDNIETSALDEVVVTDTVELSERTEACGKIRLLSLSRVLAHTIRRLNEEESISSLFQGQVTK